MSQAEHDRRIDYVEFQTSDLESSKAWRDKLPEILLEAFSVLLAVLCALALELQRGLLHSSRTALAADQE